MTRLITILMLVSALFIGGVDVSAQNQIKRETKKSKKTTGTAKKPSSQSKATGSDLSLFDVHGNVKSIRYTDGIHETFLNKKFTGPINFSKEGECTNIKTFVKSFTGDWTKVTIKRNKRGLITDIILDDGYDSGFLGDFKWDGDLLTDYEIGLPGNNGEITIKYNHGRISSLFVSDNYDGDDYKLNFSYYDFKEDAKGNWISCKVKITGKIIYDGDETTMNKTLQIKRVITYY